MVVTTVTQDSDSGVFYMQTHRLPSPWGKSKGVLNTKIFEIPEEWVDFKPSNPNVIEVTLRDPRVLNSVVSLIKQGYAVEIGPIDPVNEDNQKDIVIVLNKNTEAALLTKMRPQMPPMYTLKKDDQYYLVLDPNRVPPPSQTG